MTVPAPPGRSPAASAAGFAPPPAPPWERPLIRRPGGNFVGLKWVMLAAGAAALVVALVVVATLTARRSSQGDQGRQVTRPDPADGESRQRPAKTPVRQGGSNVDYSVREPDYTKGGPQGQELEIKKGQNRDGLHMEASGYAGPAGAFVSHGPATVYYASGKKKVEEYYSEGKLHGPSTEWFESGKTSRAGTYKDGRQHGKWTLWHQNGSPKEEAHYLDGKLHGTLVRWFATGRKSEESVFVDDLRHGTHTDWSEDGRINLKVEFVRGVAQFAPKKATKEQFRILVEVTADKQLGSDRQPIFQYHSRDDADSDDWFFKHFGKPAAGYTRTNLGGKQTWRYECSDGNLVLSVQWGSAGSGRNVLVINAIK